MFKVLNRTEEAVVTLDRAAVDRLARAVAVIRNYGSTRSFNFEGVEYKILGYGASRTTVDLKDGTVLKVERIHEGIHPGQSKAEILLWQNATKELQEHLAPILFWAEDYSWSVMVKAIHISAFEWMSTLQLRTMARKYNITDVSGSNIGSIGKSWVIIDYGCNELRDS